MAPRHPGTPDCLIRGCTKGARRLGMCSEHAALAPHDYGMQCASAAMSASFAAASKWHRKAARHVQAQLSARA